MGYTTDFEGQFLIDPPLKPEHRTYLAHFARTRRMQRYEVLVATLDDPIREAVNLPVGKEGSYYVGEGEGGGYNEPSVMNHNRPPGGNEYADDFPEWGQPGLWCQWVPTEDGTALEWDGNEKFYNYTKWLQYLLDHFLIRWGYELNGEVTWQGEEGGDIGTLSVKGHEVVATESQR